MDKESKSRRPTINRIDANVVYNIDADDAIDDMSDEEYKKIRRRFWNKKKRENRQKNKMLKKELEIQNILENYIPEDLTEYPDFPDYLDGVTHEEYAQLVKDFWIKRVRK